MTPIASNASTRSGIGEASHHDQPECPPGLEHEADDRRGHDGTGDMRLIELGAGSHISPL